MKKRIFLTAGLALMLAATFALAQGPRGNRAGGPGGPGGLGGPGGARFGQGGGGEFLSPMMARLLELTDAQRAAIQAEMQAAREAAQPLREQSRAIHEQIAEAVKSGASDSTFDTLADQQGVIAGDLLAISLKSRSKIYNTILTAEQRTKLEEIRAEFKDRRGNRRNREQPAPAPQAPPAPNGV